MHAITTLYDHGLYRTKFHITMIVESQTSKWNNNTGYESCVDVIAGFCICNPPNEMGSSGA